jgi:hypothetical protein
LQGGYSSTELSTVVGLWMGDAEWTVIFQSEGDAIVHERIIIFTQRGTEDKATASPSVVLAVVDTGTISVN